MDEEASIPTRAFPGAILPDALAANPRALTRLRAGGASQSGPSARVSFALALDTLEGPIREALEALAGSRVSPFLPPELERGETHTQECILECELEGLRALADRLPLAASLRDAQSHLDATPSAPLLMGVLNVTPDSFSDGGLYLDASRAVDRGLEMEAEGADWIDVGGESTRPGADPVSEEEELRRIVPVVKELARRLRRGRVSIDTTKAAVARAALEVGAAMVNDVSAGRVDPELLPLVARHGCEYVAMHAQGAPSNMQAAPSYGDPVAEVAGFLRGRLLACHQAGIDPERVILDPGIGFGKRLTHNLALLRRLDELRSLGRPLLLGVSRKSFIGHLMGSEDQNEWRAPERADRPSDRLGGTAAAVAASVAGGAAILRVHDVRIMAEAARVAFALADPLSHRNTSNP